MDIRQAQGLFVAGPGPSSLSLSAKRVPRELQRGRECVIRCTADVGLYADSFPVTAADRMDNPHERDGGHEVRRQRSHHVWVGTTFRCLADDLRPSVLLEDIGEPLSRREGLSAHQYEHGDILGEAMTEAFGAGPRFGLLLA